MNGTASPGSAPAAYPRTANDTESQATAVRSCSRHGNGTTLMTQNKPRPGFFRLFLSGFALGAVALVSVQVAQPAQASSWDAPVEATN